MGQSYLPSAFDVGCKLRIQVRVCPAANKQQLKSREKAVLESGQNDRTIDLVESELLSDVVQMDKTIEVIIGLSSQVLWT